MAILGCVGFPALGYQSVGGELPSLLGDNRGIETVTQCTPGRTITAKVFYKSGKSVIWDMALDKDTGKLIGNWSQSDGARGEWVTH